MHLAQLYSLTSGQRVDKINILEKYYPLNLEKYILFHPFTKPSKSFSYWQDVLEILYPILKEQNLPVVQVGLSNELLLQGCIDLRGRTSVNQIAYLTSKATLGLLCDSFVSHLAGHYDIPRVILISNNYKNCVKPYFGSPEKEIILEPDRTKKKPTFQLDEGNNKQINEIKPEEIAKSVCQLLNIPFDFPYETVYIGESYTNKILETIPTAIAKIDGLGTDSLIVRMDYEFNEQNLAFQAQHCPIIIVTDKPINLELLKAYKPRIKQIFYIITKDHSPAFASAIQKLSIPLQIFSCLPEEELNKFKLDYIDIAAIMPKDTRTKDQIKEIKDIPVNELYYKSCKHTLCNGKIYPSKAAWIRNQPCEMINQITSVEPIDCDEFYQDSEYAMIFRRK